LRCDDLFLHIVVSTLLGVSVTITSRLLSFALYTTSASTTVRTSQSKFNVLVTVKADHERRNVNHGLADSDVALADQNTSMVDGLGEVGLEDTGLEAAFQELFGGQSQGVIELLFGLTQNAQAGQAANQSFTFEQTLGMLFVMEQQ
jgi:hypothetical protein